MIDADTKSFIERHGVVLTTWRELKERRDAVKNRLRLSNMKLAVEVWRRAASMARSTSRFFMKVAMRLC
jgi:hypothetical protein